MSDSVGIPICVFHSILTGAMFPLADHVLPSLMMQPEPSQGLPCAIGKSGLIHMSKYHFTPAERRWLRSLPSGRAHFPSVVQVLLLGCSRNSSSWPSLCRARPYCLPYRKDQEVYTERWKGSSCGTLVGISISSVIRRDSEWLTERERLGLRM